MYVRPHLECEILYCTNVVKLHLEGKNRKYTNILLHDNVFSAMIYSSLTRLGGPNIWKMGWGRGSLFWKNGMCRAWFLKPVCVALIKPHYRSEGPRQGSSGVFFGAFWDYRCTFSFLSTSLSEKIYIFKNSLYYPSKNNIFCNFQKWNYTIMLRLCPFLVILVIFFKFTLYWWAFFGHQSLLFFYVGII